MIEIISKDLKFTLAEREAFLSALPGTVADGVLVKTCDRVELYAGSGAPRPEITRHLFRVVSGLESAMVGETAIQGQIKFAYEEARSTRRLSSGLHRLFQEALRVGKRVRSETEISRGALSHAKAVLEILRQDAVDIHKAVVLLIGVNNLNTELVRYVAEKGSRAVYIANRTFAKAEALARRYGATALTFEDFTANLADADIVISATSAPHFIIKREQYFGTKPVVMFDLAVPRDIDPGLDELPQVTLYNIEDIERRVDDNRRRRSNEIQKAELIIEEELSGFYDA
jgi:glutamyl-tRNA reductase